MPPPPTDRLLRFEADGIFRRDRRDDALRLTAPTCLETRLMRFPWPRTVNGRTLKVKTNSQLARMAPRVALPGTEEAMVTTLRRRATPLAALLTALFLAGPALAGPPPSVQVLSALRSMPAELAPTSRVGSSVLAPQALLGSSPEAKAATESQQTPATPQTSFSAERGWWSRRTTVQKTWFIIGMVGGAYGIYALTSHKSSSGSGGGMSGGGGGGGG